MKYLFKIALIAIFITGCSTTATLFPIEGPLSKTVPVKYITAHVGSVQRHSGDISLVMADGDTCQGKWSAAAGARTVSASGSLIKTYNSIYGSASGITSGTGKPGTAFLVCSSGRTIDMEFIIGRGSSGFGFAKDNKDNVFKVLF